MNKITKKPSANGLISLRPVHWQISKLANLLIFSRPTHLLIFTLANLLIFFACSKSDDNPTPPTVKPLERLNSWEHKPVVDTTQIYMPFLTKSEGTITLTVTANGSAWVDTNNNGVFEEGTDVKVTELAQTVTFTAPNKVFTVYGEVTELNAAGNSLTAADAGTNPALTKLNVANNQFTADALTKFIESLPPAPAPDAKVVLYAEGDSNEVTPEVRKAVVAKGWKPMHLNKEGVEEEDKDDPNSYYIELTTKIPLGNTIQLGINAAEEDRKDIWIDLNGNGVKDDADVVPTKFYEVQPYTLKAEKIRIYGKVGFLNCSDSQLTTLDFTKNQALEVLFAYRNPELVIKGGKLNRLGVSVATFHNNKNSLNLSELFILYIDPSEGVTTVNTTGLAKLQLLNLINCYDITSLALSTNTELTVLNINNSGLTSLDLTKQPKLTELQIAGTPLTELTVAEGAPLHYIDVKAYGGKGIKKEALSQLIGKLPTWKPDNKGKIFIREGQLTNEEKKTLTDKQWEITEAPGEPQKPEEDKTPPTLGVGGIKAINKTHNQVTVQWDAATDDVTPQEALHYQLLLYQANGGGGTLVKDYGIINGFSYTLQGLIPNTPYVVAVKVTDLSGNSSYYDLEVTTKANPEPYIQLTTKIAVNGTIQLYINAIEKDRNGVWIDLNGNEIKDDGEAVTIFDKPENYTLKAQTIKIYGKVDYLSCPNSQLTTLDSTKNEVLRILFAHNNPELVVKGTKLQVLGLSAAVFHKNKNNLNLSELHDLVINPSEGVTTVHTAGLTNLQSLYLINCDNITSLDLSTNTELTTLKANNSGLTSLDLTKQHKLHTLEVGGTPLTELITEKNTPLKVVDISHNPQGEGLKGIAFHTFIAKLPTYASKKGKITLSPAQYNALPRRAIDLKKKGWDIIVKPITP